MDSCISHSSGEANDTHDEETRAWALEAAHVCGQLSLLSRGPDSSSKMLQASSSGGAVTATTTSLRLFQGISFRNPVCAFLAQSTAIAHHAQLGDAGLLCAAVAARLVAAALELGHRSAAAKLQFTRACQQALAWLDAACKQPNHGAASSMLPPLSLPLPWSRMRVVLALTRAVLSPKHSCGLSSRQADHAAALIVQAFLSALEDDGLEPGGGAERLQPPVRVVAVPGLDPGDSSCEAGLMLDLPVPVAAAAQLLPAGPGLLALFDAPLDVPQADGGSGGADDALAKHRAPLVLSSSGSGGDEAWSAAGAAVQQLLQLAEVLQGLGVKVVACQRGIHPAMQQALAQRGLLPLARLSALHAAHLAQLSGCLPISSHTLPPATLRRCLGALGGVQQRQMGAKQWLLLLPPAAGPPAGRPVGPVQTLLLGAGSQAAADELKVTAESALRVLAWGLHTPMVMPGGGCAEFLMARIIRTAARAAVPRPSAVQAAAYEAFAAALEHAGAALLGGAAPRAEATAAMRSALDATLRQAAQQGPEDSGAAAPQLQYLGWHAEAQQIVPVLSCKPSSGRSAGATPGAAAGGWQVEEALLADLTLAKMCALATAVEAAIAVIRLDGALLPATSGLG